jgi:hypothetical protein
MQFNLMMGIFWLCAGGTIVAANIFGIEIRSVDSDGGRLVGGASFALSAYNFARWWAARERRKSQKDAAAALRKRPVEKPPAEYHPEFDFTRPEPPPS